MLPQWAETGLYPIVDLDRFEDDRLYIEALLQNGIGIIQLRAKTLAPEVFADAAGRIIAACPGLKSSAALIINDSVEVCRAVGAAGVHLGQADCDPLAARELLGPQALIGLSTHNAAQVRSAQTAPVDYIGYGPVFLSPTKSGHAPLTGIAGLAEAARLSRIPLVGIGGISAENAAQAYAAGAAAVAVISDLRRASGLKHQIEKYKRAAEAARLK